MPVGFRRTFSHQQFQPERIFKQASSRTPSDEWHDSWEFAAEMTTAFNKDFPSSDLVKLAKACRERTSRYKIIFEMTNAMSKGRILLGNPPLFKLAPLLTSSLIISNLAKPTA